MQYTTYRPAYGQRWDLVSQINYGDPLGYARLLEANPEYSDRVFFEGDETIRVPLITATRLGRYDKLPPWRR